MSSPDQSLRERCKKFTAIVSRLNLQTLNKRQRQVAELRIAGLSLQAIGERLGVSSERVYQIEARLKTRARLATRGSIQYLP
jgi:RNA polymerase sigma factor (sigma-70 family)